jgi:hypothetical protein
MLLYKQILHRYQSLPNFVNFYKQNQTQLHTEKSNLFKSLSVSLSSNATIYGLLVFAVAIIF